MTKVLIAYFSLTGKTEKMAEYIAEGWASGRTPHGIPYNRCYPEVGKNGQYVYGREF
jgi:hypothetical protein